MLTGCTALVWQLMKAYTLSILTKLAGKDEMTGQAEQDDIVNWVNNKVRIVLDDYYMMKLNIIIIRRRIITTTTGNAVVEVVTVCIAAEHGSFNRIRQVAPMCTPSNNNFFGLY